MNNTKSILLVAIITATLVMGISVIPMQSYAGKDNNDNHKKSWDNNDNHKKSWDNKDDNKKGKDFKSSIIASSDSSKKSASQHQDQDNFCYRGDECQQANQGQQIIGEDNDAKGFNDQSDNLAAVVNSTNSTG
jgi:hypothetical protein